ncbi:SDR family NAD(P)-dependent oxidoreductase [Phytohalomonas tamaricis]|uniref:SDR family NAD(P)-dependent oxidoreductase n=1 Tax=Phytohalomonas tamaricis TaxID=2081032 RepID=UPI000D0B2074|nr:SDR family oxidoreductase [Phytohalomonas tamaricis]
MDITLKGKTALVTGANRGIGASIAHALAQAGCDIALHTRKMRDEVKTLADEIASQYGVKVVPVVGDLSESAAVQEIFRQFDDHFKQLDILVNNAGFENNHALEDMPLDVWSELMQVNLTAPFLCSQQAARRMKNGGGGVIINIQSIHDEIMRKGVSHYSVAKAGLKMLTRASAVEWGEYGIRVVGLSPGAIETDINREDIEKTGRDKYNEWIPLGFVGETQDISGIVTFLCSEHARYVTGTTLYADGGYMHNVIRYDDRPGRD